jgi:hypothetical protein
MLSAITARHHCKLCQRLPWVRLRKLELRSSWLRARERLADLVACWCIGNSDGGRLPLLPPHSYTRLHNIGYELMKILMDRCGCVGFG